MSEEFKTPMGSEVLPQPAGIDASASASRLDIVPRRRADPRGSDVAARLDVVPRSSLQVRSNAGLPGRVLSVAAAVLVNGGFGALFLLLLDWRDLPSPPDSAIPIEVVAHMPTPSKPPVVPSVPRLPTPPSSPQAAAAPPPPPSAEAPPPAGAPPPPPLVAPPPEAAPAAAQKKPQTQPTNMVAEAPRHDTPPPVQQAVEAPRAMTTQDGSFAVPAPAPARPDAKPDARPAPEASKPDPAAQLAAALPMDTSTLPPSFRAVLSGGGTQFSDDYKGVVYGRLGRSQGPVERARAQHLRGQVVVAFSIGDSGAVSDLHVAHSSGTKALDALALDMVRDAAPFPPPPRGAARSFSPALAFGDQ